MCQQGELQGFINVKIPSRIKSRSFIPWKAWKRQWVVVRRSRGGRAGVELLIGRNSHCVLQISADDVICRTESRTQYYAFGVFPQHNKRRASVYLSGTSETDSQKWISTIRKLLKPPLLPVEKNEFSVSVIDNFFSKSAGLSGLYGTLRITEEKVTVVDPFTSKNKVEWPWTVLSQFHLSSTIAAEDKGRICTIITSRRPTGRDRSFPRTSWTWSCARPRPGTLEGGFPSGVGLIHFFCRDSIELTEKLKSRGKALSVGSSPSTPQRHHTFSCACSSSPFSSSQVTLEKPSSTPRSFFFSRRLSRSEGNLLSTLRQLDANLYGFADTDDKASLDSVDCFTDKRKVAPGIISAGLGLILSTPGGSEGDCDSLHEYQRLNGDSDDEWLFCNSSDNKFSPPRRESGVSIASGVYEEIEDFSLNLDFSSLGVVAESELESSPPPLPPRRENISKSLNEDGYINMLQVPKLLNRFLSKSADTSPVSSPLTLSRSETAEDTLCPKPSSWSNSLDCDYLPMLPSCAFSTKDSKDSFHSKEAIEEQHYVIMASVKTT